MTPHANRERVLGEIATLGARLGALREELATIDRSFSYDDADRETHRIEEPPPAAQAPSGPVGATVVESRAGGAIERRTSDAPPRPSSIRPAAFDDDFERRYLRGELLGEGGMGEVRVATDRRIGRDVALKVLRPLAASMPKFRERFLFEARVQGQLEHPSIVPVYDIGVRPDGSEYFTMKRVLGKTLHQVLKDLRRGDPGASVTFSRRRLLAAFQNVCLAAEYAHQRGVIHRDLKPANVMLGSYGEVSVLDWGVAKRVRAAPSIAPSAVSSAALDDASADTGVGEILGTPGYMSPEQAAGQTDLSAASDVFALGAILFEILTLHRLIPGESDTDVRVATLMGDYESRISVRYPEVDVPPELDALCALATARDAVDRMITARGLYDAIEKHLEGEGDTRRRRSLSRRHTRTAIAALAEAADAKDPSLAKAARARAIDEVTRALALDAENATALRMMMKLMTEVPTAMSPEAERAVRAIDAEATRKTAHRGALAYLVVIGNLAIAVFLGVRNWMVLGLACGLLLAAAAVAYAASRMTKPNSWLGIPILVLSSCGFALTSALFGPFVFAPTLVAANVIAAAVGLERRVRYVAIACGVLAVLLPVLAPMLGFVPPSWVFHDGFIEIVPRVVSFAELPTTLFLSAVSVGAVILPALVVGVERDARAKAERRLAIQAHQLAEFLPAEAKGRMADPVRESLF